RVNSNGREMRYWGSFLRFVLESECCDVTKDRTVAIIRQLVTRSFSRGAGLLCPAAQRLGQLVDDFVHLLANLGRIFTVVQRGQGGVEGLRPRLAALDQPRPVLLRERFVRGADQGRTALTHLADPPRQPLSVVGALVKPLLAGLRQLVE